MDTNFYVAILNNHSKSLTKASSEIDKLTNLIYKLESEFSVKYENYHKQLDLYYKKVEIVGKDGNLEQAKFYNQTLYFYEFKNYDINRSKLDLKIKNLNNYISRCNYYKEFITSYKKNDLIEANHFYRIFIDTIQLEVLMRIDCEINNITNKLKYHSALSSVVLLINKYESMLLTKNEIIEINIKINNLKTKKIEFKTMFNNEKFDLKIDLEFSNYDPFKVIEEVYKK